MAPNLERILTQDLLPSQSYYLFCITLARFLLYLFFRKNYSFLNKQKIYEQLHTNFQKLILPKKENKSFWFFNERNTITSHSICSNWKTSQKSFWLLFFSLEIRKSQSAANFLVMLVDDLSKYNLLCEVEVNCIHLIHHQKEKSNHWNFNQTKMVN